MIVLENCWNDLSCFECQYGAHIYDGDSIEIYVHHWLDVRKDLREKFYRKNELGYVGHCVLRFSGISYCMIEIQKYQKAEEGRTVWKKFNSFSYVNAELKHSANEYILGGSLCGHPTSVEIEIRADKFELHILEKDEPAKEF